MKNLIYLEIIKKNRYWYYAFVNLFFEGGIMKKYKCTVCGYVYDPVKGDPDGGIKPGTPFEQIPDDWVCPVCGASKDSFEPME